MRRLTIPAAVVALALAWGAVTAAQQSVYVLANGLVFNSSGTFLIGGTTARIQFGGTTSSFPALKQSGANILLRLADDSASTTIFGKFGTSNLVISDVQPTVSSGFGTSPSIVNSNGTAAFTVNVGTGGVATSGVIGLPTAATGWSCFANDRTNNTVTRQTATTTTTATFTAAAAWAASDILNISCFGY
jgi:hypothetical protein